MMSQTTAIPASSTGTVAAPGQPRGRMLPVIAIGVAAAAAVLSVIAITTDNGSSVAPPQPVVQQQQVPAEQALSGGSLDACGRPIVRDHLACR